MVMVSPLFTLAWLQPSVTFAVTQSIPSAMAAYLLICATDYLLWFKERNGPRPTKQVLREIGWSLLALFAMGICTSPIDLAHLEGHTLLFADALEYGISGYLASTLGYLLWIETWFYAVHYAMHFHPVLYKRFHSVHHSVVDTSPFSAFMFHPVDLALQGLGMVAFPVVCPMHEGTYGASLIWSFVWASWTHDHFNPLCMSQNHVVLGSHHHDIHHAPGTFKTNLGLHTVLWDKLVGTLHNPDGYSEARFVKVSPKQGGREQAPVVPTAQHQSTFGLNMRLSRASLQKYVVLDPKRTTKTIKWCFGRLVGQLAGSD